MAILATAEVVEEFIPKDCRARQRRRNTAKVHRRRSESAAIVNRRAETLSRKAHKSGKPTVEAQATDGHRKAKKLRHRFVH